MLFRDGFEEGDFPGFGGEGGGVLERGLETPKITMLPVPKETVLSVLSFSHWLGERMCNGKIYLSCSF